MPDTDGDEQVFRLMDLPPELWLRIGKYAVTYSQTLCVNHQPEWADTQATERTHSIYYPEQPAICRVNSVLRNELLPTFYMNNVFHACNQREASPVMWLRSLSEMHRGAIGKLYLSTIFKTPQVQRQDWALRNLSSLEGVLVDNVDSGSIGHLCGARAEQS